MRYLFISCMVFNLFGGLAFADQKYYGSWLEASTGRQLDIIDGFIDLNK